MIRDHAILLLMPVLIKEAIEQGDDEYHLPKTFKELRKWLKKKK